MTGVAEQLLVSALAQQRPDERAEAEKLGGMMNDPAGKALTFAMVDEVFRSHDPKVAAKRTDEGFRINLNHLGEAVLGEAEAANRLAAVL